MASRSTELHRMQIVLELHGAQYRILNGVCWVSVAVVKPGVCWYECAPVTTLQDVLHWLGY